MNFYLCLGATGWIRTSGFRDLQSLALGHSATVACLATPDGFEPPQAVLETAVLPLTLRGNVWCEWRDSNPQGLRRKILSLVCIPFHHTRDPSLTIFFDPLPILFGTHRSSPLVYYWTVAVTEANGTAFGFDPLDHILEQDRSKVRSLLHAHTVVAGVDLHAVQHFS